MKQIKSIIFDMDGTLIDSSFAMTSSVNHVRASLGLEPITQSYLEYHINAPDQNLPKLFYGTETYNPTHKELFSSHYMHTIEENIRLYDGIKELLEFLYTRGFVLSVATNASDHFAHKMLENTGINEFFSFVVGANMVSNPKPSSDIIEYIYDKTSIDAHESLLIGDSLKDELAAQNAGCEFIFVKWGYGESEGLKQAFTKVDELSNFLKLQFV